MNHQPSDPHVPATTFDPDAVDLGDTPQPAWPKVVGIITIVLASLGILCGGCGLGMLFVLPSLMKDQAGPAGLPPTMNLEPAQWGLAAFGFLLSFLSIGGGIMLLRRNFAARAVLLAYAALSVPIVIANTYFQLKKAGEMDQWVRDNPDSPFAKGHSGAGTAIGVIVGVLLGLAFPLFLLVWLGIVKRTRESFGRPDQAPRV